MLQRCPIFAAAIWAKQVRTRPHGKAPSFQIAILLILLASVNVFPQSISSGTITGVVKDESGGVVSGANVTLRNPVTNYSQSVTTDQTGSFRLNNVPLNTYELVVSASSFTTSTHQIDVRSTILVMEDISLKVAASNSSVTVEANAALVETDPSAHTNTDTVVFSKLPEFGPAAGLSNLINYSTGGTAADANGFFHPLGDHAQVSFVIDGQPISDQQSKVFSTQLPPDALQSMEIITGAPDAQYGDKSSLVVNATTKSGLGQQPFGSLEANWGSFGTYGENATLGFGGPKWGNFIAINSIRSGHFLDTPEYLPIHDIGNDENIFDHLDYQPTGRDSLHLNLFMARNWFQVPNDYDQLSQDQKQRVLTWSIAPGYQHTFGAQTLLTINPYVRRDQVNYYGSRDPFDDTPVTISQNRFLTNWGAKADVSTIKGHHTLKFGTQLQQTRLEENFALGVTDFTFNPVCLDKNGDPLLLPGVTETSRCSASNPGYQGNPTFLPGLLPFDLTRGGSPLEFHQLNNINQYAFYITDQIHLGAWTINAGLRDDQYDGLVTKNGIQPRLGIAYLINSTGTVLRAAYSRTFETPFNENLLLSSSAGVGGLAENVFGARGIVPLEPGNRNQFNAGLQQKFGRYVVFDGDYFWKYTHNGYDFDVIFNTPITFPVAWHNSKIDGFTGRVSTISMHGFQAYFTFGHNRARYFPPEVGGLINQGLASTPGVFRIDHDQAFQTTTNLRYQRAKNGPWIDLIWRYDSGLVVSGVPDVSAATQLTPNQQVSIGFSCNGVFATVQNPITACEGVGKSTLITLPQTGAENDDHNPDRVKPRNLFDVALGTDNLFRSENRRRVTLRFTVTNLTNKVALYNFLSTFSGTHFVPARTYQASIGFHF
jgi:Carboxypeptidase regulatory-like domain/TonB-dependent Receptor Plug Domain